MNNAFEVHDEPVRERDEISATAVVAFIEAAGQRVRQARQERGLSRRAVSERSGVSQRYLAQLESGQGNISIALLYKVAQTLDYAVDWFVGDHESHSAETTELIRLFASADAGQRQRVMGILRAAHAQLSRQRRICLIGVRGAGKSTLGKLASESLSIPFVEINNEIEELSGMPVDEVIALYGQEGFRELERQALEQLVESADELIVAVAGGIVSEMEAYDFLLRNFHTIWLKASPQEHMSRVRAQGDYRPMAGNPKAMVELQSLLTSRESLYAKSDRAVDTSGKTVDESLHDVLCVIAELGLSGPVV